MFFKTNNKNIMKRYLLICLAVAIALAASCAPKGEKIVVAYVTGWGSDVIPDVSKMTHINYAFGHVNETFDGVNIQNEERFRLIVGLKEQKPELKVLLSIGGWTSGRFSEMAATPETREAFAADCKRIIDTYGIDGVDIDWEYPTSSAAGISSSPDDTDNYTLLMEAIRKAIGPGKLLTYASVWNAKFIDHKAVLPTIDFVNIMAYDMRPAGLGISSALHNSELSGIASTETALKAHLDAGIPKEKLTIGLPFYGRGSAEKYADYVNYRDIDSTRHAVCWDEKAMVPYLTDENGEFVFNYENARSMRLKCQFVLDSDVLGAMYWDYGADSDEGTLRNIVAEYMLGK